MASLYGDDPELKMYEAQAKVIEQNEQIKKLREELIAEKMKAQLPNLSNSSTSAIQTALFAIGEKMEAFGRKLDKLYDQVDQLQYHQVQSSSELSEQLKTLPTLTSNLLKNQLGGGGGGGNPNTKQNYPKATPKPNLKPQPVVKESILILGGTNSNTIFIYNPIESTWKKLSVHLPSNLSFHGSAVLNGEIHIIGGYKNGVSCCEHYKLNNSLYWEQLPNLPQNLSKIGNSTVVFENSIWVIGGEYVERDNMMAYQGRYQVTQSNTGNISYRYCPQTKSWTQMAPLVHNRLECSAAVCDGKIYVAGGHGNSNILYPIEVYNSSLNQWTCLDVEFFYPRVGMSLIVSKSFIYMFGGKDINGPIRNSLRINKSAKKSENLSLTALDHEYCQAISVANEFWLLGGWERMFSQPQKHYKCEIYNGSSNQWRQINAPPVENFCAISVPIDLARKLYTKVV